MISLIVAHDEHFCIGKNGWMPWDLKEDLQHFKALTLNHKIVMGRKTFAGLKKALPHRYTYVLTKDASFQVVDENAEVVTQLEKLMDTYKNSSEVLYICGGAQVYQLALPMVDEMWISLVDGKYEGDTFFPEYSCDEWLVVTKERRKGFTIIHYRKKG